MRLIALTLFNPQKGTEQLKNHPHWIVAFLVLATLGIISYFLIHPSLIQSTLQHLPPSATNADKQIVIESLHNELPANLAFYPIRLFIGWSTFALVLLYICKGFGPREAIRFNQMLSLEVHAEAASVIGSLISGITTAAFGKDTLDGIPIGLTMLGRGQSFVIESLLTSLNIFTLWYVIVLFSGVHTLCGFGKGKSLLITMMAWALSMMFNLGAIQLLHDQLHLLL